MKAVVTVVRAHAQRYHTLLDENWQATDWTHPQSEQVLKRLESMIEALPAACSCFAQQVNSLRGLPAAPCGRNPSSPIPRLKALLIA